MAEKLQSHLCPRIVAALLSEVCHEQDLMQEQLLFTLASQACTLAPTAENNTRVYCENHLHRVLEVKVRPPALKYFVLQLTAAMGCDVISDV